MAESKKSPIRVLEQMKATTEDLNVDVGLKADRNQFLQDLNDACSLLDQNNIQEAEIRYTRARGDLFTHTENLDLPHFLRDNEIESITNIINDLDDLLFPNQNK